MNLSDKCNYLKIKDIFVLVHDMLIGVGRSYITQYIKPYRMFHDCGFLDY
jgi:hypothetical protein